MISSNSIIDGQTPTPTLETVVRDAVFVVLNGVPAVFHRPHPQKEARRYVIRQLRDFLTSAGVRP